MEAISLHASPDGYFCDLLKEAAKRNQIQMEERVSIYLINVLKTFIQPEKLTVKVGDKLLSPFDTPLALILSELHDVDDRLTRQRILRMLGEYSLYYSGFFGDYFNNKTYGIDYYMSIGKRSYQLLKNHDVRLKETYKKLADEFESYVNLVSEVSISSPIKQNKDILAVYERWTKAPSKQLSRVLREFGIQPDINFITEKVS